MLCQQSVNESAKKLPINYATVKITYELVYKIVKCKLFVYPCLNKKILRTLKTQEKMRCMENCRSREQNGTFSTI